MSVGSKVGRESSRASDEESRTAVKVGKCAYVCMTPLYNTWMLTLSVPVVQPFVCDHPCNRPTLVMN